MSVSVLAILAGLSMLLVFVLLLGQVIGRLGFRRHGQNVDDRVVGPGFVGAGAITLVIVLLTDGPWIVGLVVAAVGVAYLVCHRMGASC